MENFRLFFRWMSVVVCLLFLQGSLLAQAPADTVYTMADTVVARQLLEEAIELNNQGKYEEAFAKSEKARGIFDMAIGSESVGVADALHQMGRNKDSLGKYSEAMECYEISLFIRVKKYGIYHTDVALSNNNIGVTFQKMGNYDKAIEYKEKALNIWRTLLGDKDPKVALAYNNIGITYESKGEYEKALDYQKKALNIRLDLFGLKSKEVAQSYNTIGRSLQSINLFDEAVNYHLKALSIQLETIGSEHEDVAVTYNNLGTCYNDKGDFARAIECQQKALKILSNSLGQGHPKVAIILGSIGNNFWYKGEFEKAIIYQEKALNIFTSKLGTTHPYVASCYNNLGAIYQRSGDNEKAIEYIQKAISIYLKNNLSNHQDIALCYSNIGAIYINIKDYYRAIAFLQKSAEIYKKTLGDENKDLAMTYNNIGGVFDEKGDLDSALLLMQNAMDIRLKIFGSEHPDVAASYNSLGALFEKKGDYSTAKKYIVNSLEIRKKVLGQKHPDIVVSYNNLGNLYERMGDDSYAIDCYQKALTASNYIENNLEKVNSYEYFIDALLFISALKERQSLKEKNENLLIESLFYIEKAVHAIEYFYSSLSNNTSRIYIKSDFFHVFEKTIKLNLLAEKESKNETYLKESFNLSERSKSTLLQSQIKSSDALHYANIPDSLLTREYDLKIDITYYEKKKQEKLEQGLAETDTTVLALSSKLFDLRREYEALIERFEREYPDYHDLKYNLSTITVEEVQRELLRPNEALLEYFVGDSSIFVFVVKPDDYQVVEVKKDFPLEAWVDTLRHNIYQNRSTVSEDYLQAATDLYDKLVRPVAGLLPERLIVIPDGVLGYVPFEALLTGRPKDLRRPDRYDYLLKKHQISYCYSATLLKKMRERKHRHAPAKEFVAFSPYYTGSVQELEYLQPFQFSPDSLYAGLRSWTPSMADELQASAAEVKTVTKKIGGEAFYGSEATEARFDSIAGQYRIVHLATHGIADNRVGDYSFLAFYILPDKEENELLYVRDLYNLELNADMVVLSACETGLGELQRGEGIISLARAFAYAGAKSIVNTLWKVNDQSTSELMVLFYGYLKDGKDKDEALRLAKLAYIKQHGKRAMPFFWAGVIPVGDMGRVW